MIKTQQQTSSGGVIYKATETGIYAGLISHYRKNGRVVWCLPKGHIEQGESPERAAIREVREETGLMGRILRKIGLVQFCFYSREDEARVVKNVHFYLLEYLWGNESDHDSEADEARWVIIDDALKMLTHDNERNIMERASGYLTQRFPLNRFDQQLISIPGSLS